MWFDSITFDAGGDVGFSNVFLDSGFLALDFLNKLANGHSNSNEAMYPNKYVTNQIAATWMCLKKLMAIKFIVMN